MTSTMHELHDLRAELGHVRATHGRRSSQAQVAFENLVRAADLADTPLDGLRRHTADETERFFAFTLPGTDGHVYWDGPKQFRRNDGGYSRPRRWWWRHLHGSIDPSADLAAACGQPNCINPEHCALVRLRGTRRHWTEERIIGAIQVAAMRLGHTPSSTEWETMKFSPSHNIVCDRFGSWTNARKAAGVPPPVRQAPPPRPAFSREELLAGIRLVHGLLGRWPTIKEYNRCRVMLADAGLPRDADCVYRLYGSWLVAKKAAGAP